MVGTLRFAHPAPYACTVQILDIRGKTAR